ncbi:MAG: ATP-binding protein [Spirochaetaceae bacterium]|jgi:predicted AAA+ superfamily ATPase|nr:ATP-binding protein [Spirochaetaceae bacterium]
MKIPSEYISRPCYFDRLRPLIGSSSVKVLTGQRGVGKTHILYHLIHEIRAGDKGAHILYLDMEAAEYRRLKNGEELFGFIHTRLRRDRANYVFIDEPQGLPGFEKGLETLYAGGRCDIYLAGSNARLISGEFIAAFAEKFTRIQVYPLDYGEFLRFYQLDNTDEALAAYLTAGGMPCLAFLPRNSFFIREYLKNSYASILLRDVAAWEKIRHIRFLESIVDCLADTMGRVLSANTISGYLKSRGIGIPVQTVINYLEALEKSFLVYPLRRLDLKIRRVFETGEKYYFGDPGLWNMLRQNTPDPGDVQTVAQGVFLCLLRRGYTLYAAKTGEGEIGFAAEKPGEKLYVRPVGCFSGRTVPAREMADLEKIPDNFPKYVVYPGGPVASVSRRGIKQAPLGEFLLMDGE